MSTDKSIDLLVECQACGIENLIPNFSSKEPAHCQQCRQNLFGPELKETHNSLACEDCGFHFLLKKETPIKIGEMDCRCGSRNIALKDPPAMEELAGNPEPKPEDESAEDFDWCRPASADSVGEDYNEVFDNDPGMS